MYIIKQESVVSESGSFDINGSGFNENYSDTNVNSVFLTIMTIVLLVALILLISYLLYIIYNELFCKKYNEKIIYKKK